MVVSLAFLEIQSTEFNYLAVSTSVAELAISSLRIFAFKDYEIVFLESFNVENFVCFYSYKIKLFLYTVKKQFFEMLRKKEHLARYSSKSINAINNVSACSLLFLSTTRLFPAGRKISEHAVDTNVFLSAGNNPGVLKNSTELAETLFIAFRQFPQIISISLTIS